MLDRKRARDAQRKRISNKRRHEATYRPPRIASEEENEILNSNLPKSIADFELLTSNIFFFYFQEL